MIVAEIGINHNGGIIKAIEMIGKAKEAGADYVKFQKRNIDKCIPKHMRDIPRETPWGTMSYYNYKNRLEFGKLDYDFIAMYCKDIGMKWFASVWDIESLEFILQYDIPYIKIPSACITDIELLTTVSKCNVPVIISTGMSTVEEIDRAVKILKNTNLTILSCTSTYPTDDNELNLNKIKTLINRYPYTIGFSSHSTEILPPVVASLYGAEMLEVHVTLDKNMWGTDQSSSLDFNDLKLLINTLHKINKWNGDGQIKCYESEIPIKNKLRVY